MTEGLDASDGVEAAGVEAAGFEAAGIPDVAAALHGWRAWVVARSSALEPELVAPVRRTVWPPGRATVAWCPDHGGDVPAAGCGCGLYGVTEPGRMMGVLAGRSAIGCVALWGDVVEGTHGWRASHGYPRWLVADPGLGARSLARLRVNYGVPVHVAEIPLPDLVLLLDTVFRERADRLLTGALAWPAVAADVRGHLARQEQASPAHDPAAAQAASSRRGRRWFRRAAAARP